jgi:hypothetical protein
MAAAFNYREVDKIALINERQVSPGPGGLSNDTTVGLFDDDLIACLYACFDLHVMLLDEVSLGGLSSVVRVCYHVFGQKANTYVLEYSKGRC